MTNIKENKSLNILVTGGSGFLGSHVCDALSSAGHQVTIFDLKQSCYAKPEQKTIIGDILDKESIGQAMEGMDIVYHLAAFSDLDAAADNPVETININVVGTTNVLNAMNERNIKRIVFASTIYVNSRTGSFYRVSKHACELLLEAYKEKYGIEYTIARFGSLYGPRTDVKNGVYRLLEQALRENRIVFPGTGEEIREYIHVRDAAQICVEILKDAFGGQTLILTGHHRMRLHELIDMINEILNNKLKITYDKRHNKSHYVQTPYSYHPRIGKKIVMNTSCDLGEGLVEVLSEITRGGLEESIEIEREDL